MIPSRFDDIARSLAGTRRGVLKSLLGSAMAGVVTVAAASSGSTKPKPFHRVRKRYDHGQPCGELTACEANICRPKACGIEGAVYQLGDRNPSNPCQSCNPDRNWEGWSDLDDGDICPPPMPTQACKSSFAATCQTGTCVPLDVSDVQACGVNNSNYCCGGVCCPPGVGCEDEECEERGPVDPPGDECQNPADCPNDCVIAGQYYQGGSSNPTNECQWCDPQASTTLWSPRPQGENCGDPDDARICCNGTCCASRCSCAPPIGTCQDPAFCESIIILPDPENGE